MVSSTNRRVQLIELQRSISSALDLLRARQSRLLDGLRGESNAEKATLLEEYRRCVDTTLQRLTDLAVFLDEHRIQLDDTGSWLFAMKEER